MDVRLQVIEHRAGLIDVRALLITCRALVKGL